jgi:hypothetical protein
MQGAITLNQSIMQPLVRSWRTSDTHCGDGDRDAALKKEAWPLNSSHPQVVLNWANILFTHSLGALL